jgi:cytochrome c oxidase assembly factor CtaG
VGRLGGSLWLWHLPVLFELLVNNDGGPRAAAGKFPEYRRAVLLVDPGNGYSQARIRIRGAFRFHDGCTPVPLGLLLILSSFPCLQGLSCIGGVLGFTALEDQQLGGMNMTVPPTAIFLAAFLLLLAKWIAASSRRVPDAGVEPR